MGTPKQIWLWLTVGLGIFLILLVALILSLPHLLNLRSVQDRLLADLSQKAGAKLAFQKAEVSFFPQPRVKIYQGRATIPEKASASFASMSIYPEIRSLLRGRIGIAALDLEAPEIQVNMLGLWGEKERRLKPPPLQAFRRQASSLLGLMGTKAPGLTIRIERGKLDLSADQQPVIRFEDIHTHWNLPPNRLAFDLTCRSDFSDKIAIRGWLGQKDLQGSADVDLIGFHPGLLADHLSLRLPLRIGASSVDLKISLTTVEMRSLQAQFRGSIPYLTLHGSNRECVVKGNDFRGTLQMDGEKATVSLTGLKLDYPHLTLSGKAHLDSTTSFAQVEIEGKDIDVRTTREAILALAGEVPPVQGIFDILRGGAIPIIVFRTQGSSMAELEKAENIQLQGGILEGKIFIRSGASRSRGVHVDLEGVKGDVTISKGILEGKNLEARWEDRQARGGFLRWGLQGKDAPFHLETSLEEDLSSGQLLLDLRRFIADPTVLKEIARIHKLKGRAYAKLILGESLRSIKARVDIRVQDVFTRYERLPYDLEIHGGRLSYDGEKVAVFDLSGNMGRTSFSKVAGQVILSRVPNLQIRSGRVLIALEEIYPWLSSSEGIGPAPKDLKSVKGAIGLSILELRGPLFTPRKWRFKIGGEVKKLFMAWSDPTGPLEVSSAKFEATPERFSFADAQTRVLDASLGISGALDGLQRNLRRLDLTFQGEMGVKATQRASNLAGLPANFRVRAPVMISQGRAAWQRGGRISLSANFAHRKGPRVSIDLLSNPEVLRINRLLIQDQASNASLGLIAKKRELHIDFSGNLEGRTLDQLLVKNDLLAGSIRGEDFHAHILMDQPTGSMIDGRLQGRGLRYPLPTGGPVILQEVSVDAKKNRVRMESALLTWEDRRIALKGDVNVSPEALRIDLDLSMDGLEWEKVQEFLKSKDKNGDAATGGKIRFPPLRGALRAKLGYFTFEGHTWRPFHANVDLQPEVIHAAITEARLCGISTPGVIRVTPSEVALNFKLDARGLEPTSTLTCSGATACKDDGKYRLQRGNRFPGKSETSDSRLSQGEWRSLPRMDGSIPLRFWQKSFNSSVLPKSSEEGFRTSERKVLLIMRSISKPPCKVAN